MSLTANKTYYAVTSKVVTVTYSRGSNVSAIGSTSGTCTIRNSATNCQVTLPSITASSTYIADGWYSGSTKVGSAGAKYTVSNNTTLTAEAKADNVTLSISTTNTTNSITVVANATADSGISKYEFSKDGGNSWVNGGTNKTYTFSGLTQGTAYNIQVRVTASSGKTTSTSKSVTTSSLTKPTFNENTNGDVVISYPSGCTHGKTCSYSQNNGNNVTVTGSTTLSFGADGTVVATVTDGTNTVSSTYTFIKRDLYVSTSGSDTTGYGTISKPYATLTRAYDSATSTQEATIYIMNKVTQADTTNMDDNKKIILTSYSESDDINSLVRSSSLTSYMIYQTNGNLTLKNITIDGNNIAAQWAMVFIGSDASIEDGTTLRNANNQNDWGGAIWVNGGVLTMNGGELSNNKTVAGGSAVFVSPEAVTAVVHHLGTFIMNDGIITNNTAFNGAIYNGGNTTINNGTISNNTAELWGGGIWSNGTLRITGGIITENKVIGNTAGNWGGGGVLYQRGSTFTQTGGTITSNTPNNVATG